MRRQSGNWGRKAVLVFTLLNVAAGVIVFRPALMTRAAASAQSQWKEDILKQMTELEATIASLKQGLANNPKDQTLSARLQAALTQYDQLSAQMGGDRPSATAVRTAGKVSVPSPTLPSGGLGVIPTPPTGCTASTATFTNSTPVAIPTGPAVVTSTVIVSGAGPYLWDLNAQTFITHTFAADLDITIQSPAGTVVTLTTDNGAGNDDVFNGTVWDDQANPGGQVPYTTNNGLVTDHAYVNLTLASPLVPEEAMGAFIGENPNGTWTITISDDLAGDGGSLNSWALEVTTFAAAPTATTTSFSQNTPVAIPTGPAVVTSTVVVSGAGTSMCNVTLTTNLTHTFAADLDITLQSPTGKIVTLTTDNGAGNDNVFNGTLWSDKANPAGQVPYTTNNGLVTDHAYINLTTATPLVPEEAMAAFNGDNPNGTWTITISDDLAGDGGSLDSWTLNVTTCSCAAACVLTCPTNITTGNDPNQCGAVVNYPAPTTTGACGTVTCTPASGSFFPVGTTTVTCSAVAQTITTVYSSGNIAVPIPDNNTLVTVPINVPDTGTVTDVNVRIRLDHTNDSDLAIGLSHASGGITLSTNNGGSGDNYGSGTNDCSGTKTVFDDAAVTSITAGAAPFAGSFKPQSPLSFFLGTPNDGTWSLNMIDSVPGNTGTIGCFELELTRQEFTTCSFTVTVNDTQPPTITCPANVTTVAAQTCPLATSGTVTFPPPTASDNCPGVTAACIPPSGSIFPVGTTTVTCTATDASGNTASCSFSVTLFAACLQDDSVPTNVILFSPSGAYTFCCNGMTFSGTGIATVKGCVVTIQHNLPDRRVLLTFDGAVHRGTASLQSPPGTTKCTITDRNTLDNTCACQ